MSLNPLKLMAMCLLKKVFSLNESQLYVHPAIVVLF